MKLNDRLRDIAQANASILLKQVSNLFHGIAIVSTSRAWDDDM